ncbi:hypothetical protein KC318_g10606 [Hortaea werneckii]|nr:hypothetical protein KC334_g4401 [Hortaea werneckii]KAI7025910.1 hypothetical protein KC355_g847 [Hortaea werneckii]KAI7171730.1 hypothetical protein KC324_g10895 [Hortaea werneckii]KAI7581335.1 hypothetical protein KC316_g8490 [Hortaea werneckii]KAI7659543.1 hypothetical protein KC318_g10606 [Hortaea werneckii]
MAHHPPNDNPNHLLPLYTRVASAQTSLSLFAFPPTSRPSPAEIRSAYKTLALALHPDKAPPGREGLHTALFQKVHAAFQDLSNHPKQAGETHDTAAGEEVGGRGSNVPRIEDSLHARVHDFREWLKMQRSAEVERKKGEKGARGGRVSKGDHGHEVFSEGWEGPDVVVEGKKESILAGSKACVARSAQIHREEEKKSRFLEGAGSKVRAEKRLDRLYASGAISTREYEKAWMALDDMPEREEEVQGFVDQEPELCEMLGITTSDPPPPPAGTEAGQRLIANAVDAEELSEGVAANLGLLLVEVTPSRSGQKAICRGRKSQPVDSWEEEEDRLAASVSGK